ncbi:N-acetylneuraminate synthase [Paracnuella aquatica]|uniref:N-acetylneuraminate synthase n=1 Tax=Paracnuella aquatica TaxID=2268757 RepID=UPI000DEEF84F|nr:N-acetylneuraminate synthase [Paracnuella aquatica]RPD45521.1 N-acetylneuraminate synthase [Paracnuella aquatica]
MKKKTLIIAEAGVNHNGSLDLAKQLIDVAAGAGVDIVKFQTFKASKIASNVAAKADYQKQTTGANDSQLSMLQKLELDEAAHDKLLAYCKEKGIAFLSTPFDLESIVMLREKGITIGKIPSGEITNLPYLEAMAKAFRHLILSTGMATMQDVQDAMAVLKTNGVAQENITVLHCNTEYPTPMQDVNLKAMEHLRQELGVEVGYSDHTLGIEVPIAAVAMGATVIEKHFTLDRNMEGPDHRASLEPAELVAMVKAIRNIESALSGPGIKIPSESEKKNMAIARKSIVAARTIAKGEILTPENITVKRPGSGISPMRWYEVCGTAAKRDFEADELITL